MDTRVKAAVCAAIDIPELQYVTYDSSAHDQPQFAPFHPEIPRHDLGSLYARVYYQNELNLLVPLHIRGSRFMGFDFGFLDCPRRLNPGDDQVAELV